MEKRDDLVSLKLLPNQVEIENLDSLPQNQKDQILKKIEEYLNTTSASKTLKKMGADKIASYIMSIPFGVYADGVAFMRGNSLIIDFRALETQFQINDLQSFLRQINSEN